MPILTDQERIGTLLGDRYRIDAILGRGGMGVVFRAHQEDDGTPVAVKILRPELAQQDPQFAKRFVREARAAATVRHTNVVEIRDVGEDDDGTIYQVLELLEGETLREHLQRKGRLEAELALELLLPVMHALEAAHSFNVVHRDLKPDNIFLARQASGEVKPTLLDFGIAKLLDARGGSFATNTGSIMGTPAYMAPEQAGGYKDQGPAIDVWAMGIIAYECFAGAPPFTGSSPAHVMLRIMTETPAPLDHVVPGMSVGIARVIERALVRAPAERHASMAVFREALREAADREGISVPAQGRSSTTRVLSLAPPADAVATAPTDAATPNGHDSGVGAATMGAQLRREREARASAKDEAATRALAKPSLAADSISVTIDTPSTGSRVPWVAGAIVVTVLLGLGVGVALYGGASSPSSPPTTASVAPPPSTVTTPVAPPTTPLPPPPVTAALGVEPPPSTDVEPPPTTTRVRGPRTPREGSAGAGTISAGLTMTSPTGMEATSPTTERPPTQTMETMESTTRMGGLPSVVGWEDE